MARGMRDGGDGFDSFGTAVRPTENAETAGLADQATAERAEGTMVAGPTAVDIHVGARIKLRRALLGLSQERLGERLGLTFQQIQKYERGTNRVSASRLHDLGRVLDVPVSFFFDGITGGPVPSDGRVGGFAEAQDAFGLQSDVLSRKETLDLVGAFWRITDPDQRRRVLDLVKSMAPPRSG